MINEEWRCFTPQCKHYAFLTDRDFIEGECSYICWSPNCKKKQSLEWGDGDMARYFWKSCCEYWSPMFRPQFADDGSMGLLCCCINPKQDVGMVILYWKDGCIIPGAGKVGRLIKNTNGE